MNSPSPDRVTGSPAFDASMPALFVCIWATGFVVARLVAPHVDPLTFLAYRFVACAALFSLIVVAVGAPWPQGWRGWWQAAVAGVLLQGLYLGGVFWSVNQGLPASICALLAGLQPLLTALLAAPLLGERVGAGRWLGILLGLVGALLVLLPTLSGHVSALPLGPLLAAVIAVLGITFGTLWQKHTAASSDLRSQAAVQFMAAALLITPIALLTEQGRFDMSWQSWSGLLWAVFGLSMGAISLLLIMIKRGAVTRVASLFYLVPPLVAVMAYLLFDEQLSTAQIAGMLLAALGVAIASRAPPPVPLAEPLRKPQHVRQ
ncbi:MAG: DMT family transporter [Pseudomonas sp.]|uniref:DMT family transporter n=1 Tax=Pseudomonas sp. TaxID=306 RepID=UPI0033943702